MTQPHFRRRLKASLSVVWTFGLVSSFQACGKFDVIEDPIAAADGIKDLASEKTCGSAYNPGHTMIHRLTNDEYNNTVRDLLYTDKLLADQFQSSTTGSGAFSNDSESLQVSPQLVSDYAAAAETLAAEVIASKGKTGGALELIAPCSVTTPLLADCAQKTIRDLARRAFRKPISATGSNNELQSLLGIYQAGGSFEQGLNDVIVALLIDPRFLFVSLQHENPQNPASLHALSAYELASRLSYFLWQSMPDEALFKVAEDTTLLDPEVMKAQIGRMLKDSKVKSLATILRREWAHLAALDSTGLTGVDTATEDAIKKEPQLFLEDIIMNDRSWLDVVTSDSLMVNNNLAAHYGLNASVAPTAQFVRVKATSLPRRGIMTQAAVMIAQGGGGTYTHPVPRGRWATDSLLCDPPPPRPPNVPILSENINEGTMRQRLEQHVRNPVCLNCHKVMDVVGLGLENYDILGRYRTNYDDANHSPIDASGQFPASFAFADAQGLMSGLGTEPKVKACLTRKLMSLAVARLMGSDDDKCVSGAIGELDVTASAKFSDLISDIALSRQFRANMGEGN